MVRQIILLSGKSRSGKDVLASVLANEFKRNAQTFSIASALKNNVAAATGIPIELFYDARKDQPLPGWEKTPRELLLAHALVERAIDTDVYLKSTCAAIEAATNVTIAIISDWRYKREAEFFEARFPIAVVHRVRIVRPGLIPATYLADDHSEHDLDNERMNVVIQNDGTLADLEGRAVRAFIGLCA